MSSCGTNCQFLDDVKSARVPRSTMSDTGDTFCKKMRRATREIHALSDSLVNAKLAFGMILTKTIIYSTNKNNNSKIQFYNFIGTVKIRLAGVFFIVYTFIGYTFFCNFIYWIEYCKIVILHPFLGSFFKRFLKKWIDAFYFLFVCFFLFSGFWWIWLFLL